MHEIEKYIKEYAQSLSKMNDNRLKAEWYLQFNNRNSYSGKPLKFKLDLINKELEFRKIK